MSNNEKIKGAFSSFVIKAIPYGVVAIIAWSIGKFA